MIFVSFLAGNRVMCFTCNSHEDYRCRDSFNWTDPPEKKACAGCCVKMVQGIGTGEEKSRGSEPKTIACYSFGKHY